MGARDTVIEEYTAQLQACMYQYSRAIYRSIKDLIDPYVAPELHLEYRRAVLEQCEQTMERLAKDPLYFAKPDRALFQDIRRYFPITAQAEVAWAVKEGVAAAVAFIEEQIESGVLDGGVARCRATTRKGQAVPAHAAPRARLLPVAPASRALQSRRLTGERPYRSTTDPCRRVPVGPDASSPQSRAWHVTGPRRRWLKRRAVR